MMPFTRELASQYSATVSRRLDFSNGSANGTNNLGFVSLHHIDELIATKREKGWHIPSLAAQCHALRSLLVLWKCEVGPFPVFRWAFAAREFPNMKPGPKGQPGPKSEHS